MELVYLVIPRMTFEMYIFSLLVPTSLLRPQLLPLTFERISFSVTCSVTLTIRKICYLSPVHIKRKLSSFHHSYFTHVEMDITKPGSSYVKSVTIWGLKCTEYYRISGVTHGLYCIVGSIKGFPTILSVGNDIDKKAAVMIYSTVIY